jgi:hypothetical protein
VRRVPGFGFLCLGFVFYKPGFCGVVVVNQPELFRFRHFGTDNGPCKVFVVGYSVDFHGVVVVGCPGLRRVVRYVLGTGFRAVLSGGLGFYFFGTFHNVVVIMVCTVSERLYRRRSNVRI